MSVISVTVAICYFLISFLAVTFPKPYQAVFFSSLAEIFAYLISGWASQKMGSRISLATFFTISALGGFLMWSSSDNPLLLTSCVMMSKFGVSGTYNIQLCALKEVFPTNFVATSFGVMHLCTVCF